jgi:4a-hydroxytetrahydrobiopterin dehydratase
MPAMTDNRLRPEGEAMPRLDDTAVEEGLQHLPGWERRGDEIVKTFVREDFAHAMVFVNEVAGAAEAAGHHPDIDIRWNKVTLALSSHAEGGLTDRDFQLAGPTLLWGCRGWGGGTGTSSPAGPPAPSG